MLENVAIYLLYASAAEYAATRARTDGERQSALEAARQLREKARIIYAND